MKIDYKFEGNKVIKTTEFELTEKEVDLLKRIHHEYKVNITSCPRWDEERELTISVYHLMKCDLVKDQFGIDEYMITEIGHNFLKSYNDDQNKILKEGE